ncbi:MAG: TonB-dependent receptor [Halioglobus sp.]
MSRTKPHAPVRMFKRKLLAAAIAPLCVAMSTQVVAQNELEEVLITGSYIKGTSTDEASPVEVIGNEYIANSGAFTVGELTAKLAVNSGSENQADSFTSGATQGTSNVNLRGLGLSSTLVLINGRRQANAATLANDGSVFVDTNTIPVAALERVEILKEGAATAYGSDAVAGVVNYILKKDFEGFEINGGYQTTESDNQDTTEASFLAGFGNDTTNFTLSGAIMRQDPLSAADRPELVANAISSLGRSFIMLGPDEVTSGDYAGTYSPGENVPDPNCNANGGLIIPQGFGARCGFAYGPRFNLVNEEESNQLFGNVTHDFSDTLTLTAELGWTDYEVKDNPQSPSYPALSFPFVFPGQAGSPFNVPVVWLGRPLGSDFASPNAPRESETYRGSLALDGNFTDNWTYNAALTYSSNERDADQPDTQNSRLNAAIAGVGGPNGDETFNLFDSSANSQELIDYISTTQKTNRKTELLVGDFVVSGDLFEMGAGPVGFAAGLQYRDESYEASFNDVATQKVNEDGSITPADLIFLGGGLPVDEDRQSYAAFAEMQIPLTDSLEVNLAARYENLDTDDSIDPKIAIRWQALDSVVLRASASTAFREPSLSQFNAFETSLQGLQDFNPDGTTKGGVVFVRVTAAGNKDLETETSTNYNLGAIWQPTDNFDARIDYWRFEYDDVITVESAQGKLQNDLNGEDIIRVAGPNSQLAGVNANYINAASVDTDGLDVAATYIIPTASMGEFGLNLTGTHFLSYEIPNANGRGTRDVAGFFNHDNFARSIPETKINLSADWTIGNHSAAAIMYWVDEYETTRAVPAGESQKIDDWTTVDLNYTYNLEFSESAAVISVGAKNVFDEEPPRVYDAANFSYDPKHHDPRGRIYYARVKYAF